MSKKYRQILFVCTGNICRSPMAEYLFRHRIKGRFDWTAASAGIAAFPGGAASHDAITALKDKGIDASGHISRPMTRELIESSDLILTMTRHHADALLHLVPDAAPRVRLLTSFSETSEPADIPDPIGQSLQVYRHTRDVIDSALADLILYLAELDKHDPPMDETKRNP